MPENVLKAKPYGKKHRIKRGLFKRNGSLNILRSVAGDSPVTEIISRVQGTTKPKRIKLVYPPNS